MSRRSQSARIERPRLLRWTGRPDDGGGDEVQVVPVVAGGRPLAVLVATPAAELVGGRFVETDCSVGLAGLGVDELVLVAELARDGHRHRLQVDELDHRMARASDGRRPLRPMKSTRIAVVPVAASHSRSSSFVGERPALRRLAKTCRA